MEACIPVLRKVGWSAEMIETARKLTVEEVRLGYPKFSYKVVFVWAIKK